MNGTLNAIIEYFRSLAFKHKKIKGFKTGEIYETNEDFQDYPVLWLRLPIQINYAQTTNNEIDKYLNINLSLAIYTKIYEDLLGNEHTIALDDTKIPTNEIEQTEPLVKNKMINDCLTYMNHIISKFVADSDDAIIPALYSTISAQTQEYEWDDKTVGVIATFNIRWFNQDKCEFEDFFEEDTTTNF